MIDIKLDLAQIQRIADSNVNMELPSYDQFISLVEGLEVAGQGELLSDGTLFAISDAPGARRHLLVSLGKVRGANDALKILDKDRAVSVTNRTINCYETGVYQRSDYANRLKVGQAWIIKI